MIDNLDEIMAIAVAFGLLAIFLWGQYAISKAPGPDCREDKK